MTRPSAWWVAGGPHVTAVTGGVVLLLGLTYGLVTI